jgi:spermidine synthase
MSSSPIESKKNQPAPIELALLASVFAVAACGLLYELAAGAIASYVLGDSILQFSTIIGTYLFAMGVGSWLSRYIERQLPAQFLRIELLIALVGGMLPAVLFLANAYAPQGFRPLLYGLVMLVGALVGLEIPLVMRLLKRHTQHGAQLKDLVSQVLTFDYLGALAVSIAFPLLLVPQLGLVRTGLLFGLLNAAVALWALWLFRHELRAFKAHLVATLLVISALLAGFIGAEKITTLAEDKFYQDSIVFSATSPYQRIVVTNGKAGHRLYLNGNLQFAQRDEYRYHEALVHPVMAAHGAPKRVAVLGGGDGMAVREILKYPSVEQITLVELDPNMTELFSKNSQLAALNGDALRVGLPHSDKVVIVNTDAFKFLETTSQTFDVIIVDFPDPSNFSLGKLYSTSFYALLDQRLSASGYAVIQSTSPLVARKSFWTVVRTVEEVGLKATPYHAHVPSFGEWGFIVASRRPFKPVISQVALPKDLRFLNSQTLPLLFDFPLDMARVNAEPNRMSNQTLVLTFEEEWGKVLQ